MWPCWSKFVPGAWTLWFSETQVRNDISLFLLPADPYVELLAPFPEPCLLMLPLRYHYQWLFILKLVLWEICSLYCDHTHASPHPSQLSPLPNLSKVKIFKKKIKFNLYCSYIPPDCVTFQYCMANLPMY